MGLADILISLLNVYSMLLFGRALMSWIDPTSTSTIGRFIYQMTEPVIEPIRRVIRPMGGIDFSIMATIFLCIILQSMIRSVL